MPHPVILVGLPEPYVKEFYDEFSGPATNHSIIKKPNSKVQYVRISKAVDVYRVCKMLDGKTRVHQKAINAIMKKLESKYGKENLEASLT